MNDYSPRRSLQRPLLGYVGLAAALIAVSHGLTLLLGIRPDIPIMSYGIVSGVICGLAVWTACGQGRCSMRFSVSLTIVLSLSVFACWSWNLIPRSLFRGPGIFFSEGELAIPQATWQAVVGFLFVWAPLQAATVWFGWRPIDSSAEYSLRDGRRLRMRLLFVVIAVLLIAVVILRAMEHGAPFLEYFTTIEYVVLFPLSAIFGVLYVPLVWGWLVAARFRYSIAASVPYGLLFVWFFVASGLGGLGWLLRGPVLLHAIFFFGALITFRLIGWQLAPYSRTELGY